jgi:hypothetical protein
MTFLKQTEPFLKVLLRWGPERVWTWRELVDEAYPHASAAERAERAAHWAALMTPDEMRSLYQDYSTWT